MAAVAAFSSVTDPNGYGRGSRAADATVAVAFADAGSVTGIRCTTGAVAVDVVLLVATLAGGTVSLADSCFGRFGVASGAGFVPCNCATASLASLVGWPVDVA